MLAIDAHALGTPSAALAVLGATLQKAIAGSSGPFYATALMRASRRLGASPSASPSPQDWADAFAQAVGAISELGGAKAGDRTMLDALIPAAEAFGQSVSAGHPARDAWGDAVAAAERGAEATASMTPRAGRASYMGERAMGAPDGGAAAVAIWLAALAPHVGAS
jgi:triose/dihydroxyacetone kinase / FAD-AMP lyase (cyclizing)